MPCRKSRNIISSGPGGPTSRAGAHYVTVPISFACPSNSALHYTQSSCIGLTHTRRAGAYLTLCPVQQRRPSSLHLAMSGADDSECIRIRLIDQREFQFVPSFIGILVCSLHLSEVRMQRSNDGASVMGIKLSLPSAGPPLAKVGQILLNARFKYYSSLRCLRLNPDFGTDFETDEKCQCDCDECGG